jgi:flagellar hook-length control protein FliK
VPHQPLAEQISIQIKQGVASGADTIRIHLQPQELGNIDVVLEVKNSDPAQIRIIADRAETLELLQKDGRLLEKALAEAGLKTDSGSLQFSLKEHGQGHHSAQGFGQNGSGREGNYETGTPFAKDGAGSEEDALLTEVEDGGVVKMVTRYGLNIRI